MKFIYATAIFLVSCNIFAKNITFDCSGPSNFRISVPYPMSDFKDHKRGLLRNGSMDANGIHYNRDFYFNSNRELVKIISPSKNIGKEPVHVENIRPESKELISFIISFTSIYFHYQNELELTTQEFVINGTYNPREQCQRNSKVQKMMLMKSDNAEGSQSASEVCSSLPESAPKYGPTIINKKILPKDVKSFKISIKDFEFNCAVPSEEARKTPEAKINNPK